MATLGEFGSLLQLGFGAGVGLSVFRAPMDIRATRLGHAINAEMAVVRNPRSPKAKERRGELATLKLAFEERRRVLDRINTPFMFATVGFAFLNLAALIWGSHEADRWLTSSEEWGLVFVSVGYFLIVFIALEVIARWVFRDIRRRLAAVTGRA